jgi:predicted transcriptional regulator of viral defense system
MQTEQIIELAKTKGVIRASDVEAAGASRTLLPYLAKQNKLRRLARGAYIPVDLVPENEDYLQLAAAIPHGVLCLLSALQFHELTTQLPLKAWVAVERGTYLPSTRDTPIRIVQFSGPAFTQGIEAHTVGGLPLRVYSPAKTVVDCFKFRHRLGIDIAREALVDCLAQKKASRDDIWNLARACRMQRIIRPYLEMSV